jgi:hypothetical protein
VLRTNEQGDKGTQDDLHRIWVGDQKQWLSSLGWHTLLRSSARTDVSFDGDVDSKHSLTESRHTNN